jgi:hypothetical protein
MTDRTVDKFLNRWTAENIRPVKQSNNQDEAKRLAKACFQAAFKNGISGEKLIEASGRITDGGRLHAYMLQRLQKLTFSALRKSDATSKKV